MVNRRAAHGDQEAAVIILGWKEKDFRRKARREGDGMKGNKALLLNHLCPTSTLAWKVTEARTRRRHSFLPSTECHSTIKKI